MSIRRWLGLEQRPEGSGPDERGGARSLREIVDRLDAMDPDHARYVAGFAYILGRVADVEEGISEEETEAMERLVSEAGHLPEEESMLVVRMAKTHNHLFGETENFLVTREFAAIADRDQKEALLDCLYAVSAADESVSSVEDTEIRKIAGELGMEHRDVIRARRRYREYLDVLKQEEDR
ncbi:MAG: TerB family tellurite resistance protein [bacterium]